MWYDILRSFFKTLGPGIITGSSDDDPSGIATYSQAGAQFGFGLLWMTVLLYPLIIAIQEMCARIGLVTGGGLASAIKRKYPRKIVYPIASLLLIANIINIGADIGAMAASLRLIFPQIPVIVAAVSFTITTIFLEIFITYRKYVKILRFLALSLLVYIVTAIIVGGNINQIIYSSIVPHIELKYEYAMLIVAIIGATFSPYLFFWQTSEEAEEDVAQNKIKEIGEIYNNSKSKKNTNNTNNSKVKDNDSHNNKIPKISRKEIRSMRID
ncbi:MAG: divalent metal cation transporter, partial [Thermoproteota archaeon]|nr:divalent metal cation transporter [Thermoproteota archaeon]